jgi:signal transduction histidine kinase
MSLKLIKLKSLKIKLIAWFSVWLLLVYVSLSLYFFLSHRAALYQKLDSELKLTAVTLTKSLKLEENQKIAISSEANSILGRSIKFRIFNSAGQLIFEHWPNEIKDGTAKPANFAILTFAGQGKWPAEGNFLIKTVRLENKKSWRILLFKTSISQEEDEEREAGKDGLTSQSIYLLGLKSTIPIDEELEEILRIIIIGGIVVLLPALAGGIFISKRALKPVQAISSTLKNISASNLKARIPPSSYDRELIPLVEQLNEALERLEKAFERERQFTADASHELRTPLTAIINSLEVLKRRHRTCEEYQEANEEILKMSLTLQNIIEDLLMLARIEAGKSPLQLKEVSLFSLSNDAWKLLENKARQKNITFSNDISPDFKAKIDPDKIKRVFLNLFKNAIDYNRPEGHVWVKAELIDNKIIIEIINDGPEIPAEKIPYIFDRFYRGDESHSSLVEGAGLGLPIVRAIVELHKGEIKARSEGGLTSFIITLPFLLQ